MLGFGESISLFDKLRPQAESGHTDFLSKVNLGEYNQLLASLSIQMGTMACNHLITNLEQRLKTYLSWKHPDIKRFHGAIVRAVIMRPKDSIDDILNAASEFFFVTKPVKECKKKKKPTPDDEEMKRR